MKTVEKVSAEKTTARRGGRPSRGQAEQIRGQILDVAQKLFFSQGYGATSIESIASQARMSKRTFYTRFSDKADLFKAVVHHVVEGVRPPDMTGLFTGKNCEEILLRLAVLLLRATLSPDALALHRLLLAEATRFPELALVANNEGTRTEAIKRIAALLQNETDAKRLKIVKPAFAAEQFLVLVAAQPQRRALGMGQPMTQTEIDAWAKDSVALFLNGCR